MWLLIYISLYLEDIVCLYQNDLIGIGVPLYVLYKRTVADTETNTVFSEKLFGLQANIETYHVGKREHLIS